MNQISRVPPLPAFFPKEHIQYIQDIHGLLAGYKANGMAHRASYLYTIVVYFLSRTTLVGGSERTVMSPSEFLDFLNDILEDYGYAKALDALTRDSGTHKKIIDFMCREIARDL